MKTEDTVKLFGLNNLSIEAEVRRVERENQVDFGHKEKDQPTEFDAKYYPQFPERLRDEASAMATHYTVFYCLENFIRELITERLDDEYGKDWWETNVPDVVKVNAKKNRQKEDSTGITPRSVELIDYSNFGELGEILKSNWDIFGDTFNDIKAVERVLSNLNTLRAPIAHCKSLAEDEVLRLHLSLRDWFRQME